MRTASWLRRRTRRNGAGDGASLFEIMIGLKLALEFRKLAGKVEVRVGRSPTQRNLLRGTAESQGDFKSANVKIRRRTCLRHYLYRCRLRM